MIKESHATQSNADPRNLVSYDKYLQGLDLTRTTGWRWRRDGLIKTIDIHGRLYVSRDEIERFERRALAGEFSKKIKTSEQELAAA